MEDLTENKISKMIKQKVQGNLRFQNCVLICHNNHYIIEQIDLTPKEAKKYKEVLDVRSKANILKKTTNCVEGCRAEYSKDIQLMNKKVVHIIIAYYSNYVSMTISYKDKNINLYEDRESAEQMAIEIILPELDNILNIINIENMKDGKEEKTK